MAAGLPDLYDALDLFRRLPLNLINLVFTDELLRLCEHGSFYFLHSFLGIEALILDRDCSLFVVILYF